MFCFQVLPEIVVYFIKNNISHFISAQEMNSFTCIFQGVYLLFVNNYLKGHLWQQLPKDTRTTSTETVPVILLLVEHALICWDKLKKSPNFGKFLGKYMWVGFIYIPFEPLFALSIENAWKIHILWSSLGYAVFDVNCFNSNSFLINFSSDVMILLLLPETDLGLLQLPRWSALW